MIRSLESSQAYLNITHCLDVKYKIEWWKTEIFQTIFSTNLTQNNKYIMKEKQNKTNEPVFLKELKILFFLFPNAVIKKGQYFNNNFRH